MLIVGASARVDPAYKEGSRVRVHDIKLSEQVSDQVAKIVRVPKDPDSDGCEITAYHLLRNHFDRFLPNAEILSVSIEDSIRTLLICDKIETQYSNSSSLSGGVFLKHLNELPDLQDKVKFLANLREFVDSCKEFFKRCASLPDLIGRGNLVCKGSDLYLLDFNNLSFKTTNEGSDKDNIHVPLDEKGYPIFDLSLRLLYHLEKKLLTYNGRNLSSQEFNTSFRQQHSNKDQLPEELKHILVDRETLKKDPFYGAVRFKERREKAQRIWEKIGQRYFI